MEIFGIFSTLHFNLNYRIPKNWDITGYMTSDGPRFCINKNTSNIHKYPSIFQSDLYTTEQVEKQINNYHRKQKLKVLNGTSKTNYSLEKGS
jgi:hypothetical protein